MSIAKRIWVLGNLTTLLIVLLSTRVVYWQVVRGDDLLPLALSPVDLLDQMDAAPEEDSQEIIRLAGRDLTPEMLQEVPQPVVQRTSDLLESITRGSIYDRNGRLLASDRTGEDGERIRFYTEPSLSQVIGYVSGLRTGVSGLERYYNETLLGLNRPDAQLQKMFHEDTTGSDLILTIDSFIQRAAEKALEGQNGSITVFDGSTGAVLAMASAPYFDPNRMLDAEYVADLVENCGEGSDCQGILLNRASQALYTPGSTWKTVTLLAALDAGQVEPGMVFDFGEPVQGADGPYYVYRVDGGTIPDPNHREDKLTLEMSYAKSANAAFARIGDEMPPDVLIEYARRFGFSASEDEHFPIEIGYSPAQLARDVDSLYENNLLRAVTAIGQGELLTTPLHMGMVVLAAVNEGNLPLPYFVERIQDPQGETLRRQPQSRTIPNLVKPETAALAREMMVTVVEQGSGRKAALEGVQIGGKTGTAQVGGDREPHAWFTGFAEEGERSVVIVVMIEHGGEGSQTAAPIFAQMADVALHQAGQPVDEVLPTPAAPEPTQPAEEVTAQTGDSPEWEAEATPETPPQATQDEPAEENPPAPAATATPPAGQAAGLPEPDIPYREGAVPFTEKAAESCPGLHEPVIGTGEFGWPSQYQSLSGGDFREGHAGLDLSTPPGTPVYAADTGLVTFAGWTGGLGYGNAIVIDHGNGFHTLYAHLTSVSKHCGAQVEKGDLIGMSGSTGNSSGAHLHFEVRVPGGYVNPLRVLPIP